MWMQELQQQNMLPSQEISGARRASVVPERRGSVMLPSIGRSRPSPIRVKRLERMNSMVGNSDLSSALPTTSRITRQVTQRLSHQIEGPDTSRRKGSKLRITNQSSLKMKNVSETSVISPHAGTALKSRRQSGAINGFSEAAGRLSEFQTEQKQKSAMMAKLPKIVPLRKGSIDIYKNDFQLDMDSQLYTNRQHQRRIGNFYDQVVKKHVLQTDAPNPLLEPERRNLIKSLGGQNNFGKRNASLSQMTRKNIDVDPNSRLHNIEQALQREIGADVVVFPRLTNVMSQDHLATHMLSDEYKHKNIQSMANLNVPHNNKHMKTNINSSANLSAPKDAHGSNVTDNRQTAVETQPLGHSASMPTGVEDVSINKLQIYDSSIMEESMVMMQSKHNVPDPLAGNSVINQLNQSLKRNAQDQIDVKIAEGQRERSRQRRRRELAGEKEIKNYTSNFIHKSVLEQVSKGSGSEYDLYQSSATSTSLADSEIYHMLIDELDTANSYIKKDLSMKLTQPELKVTSSLALFKESKFEKQQKLRRSQQKEKNAEKQALLMRDNPDAYFKKLKAMVKLKAVKKYQEDEEKKVMEEEKAKQPLVVIRDKFGRIIEKKAPNLKMNREPSLNRKPRKKQPPKRLRSFTEEQMKFYTKNDIFQVKETQPSMIEQAVIDCMKEADRFPIPEQLVGRQISKSYNLRIDSLINAAYSLESVNEWAQYQPDLDAPYNSMESEEEFPLHDSEESESANRVPYIPSQKLEENPELKRKQFDAKLLDTMPWRIESMRYYPYRGAEGEFPVKLLKIPKLQTIFDAHDAIQKQQMEKRWSYELIQNVFEHFCIEMKAAPMNLSQFYNYDDPNCAKISIKNINLDEQVMKAIIMILPYMQDFVEIEFSNNHINDSVASALVFAVFANPSLRRITIAYNYMRLGLTRCLSKLMGMRPHKLDELNLMGSILYTDHIDPIMRQLSSNKTMRHLNIAGCQLTHASCRMLSQFITTSYTLSHLDVSHCRISFQGSRYMIDALNRNITIRNFNFSHNDLTSESFEFSIKVASIITRHPSLMHLDITNTNLKREEIIFIGLSLPVSKTLLACHLTAQKLPYYERIFLRAAIAARVGFQNRKGVQRKDVRSNKERNQILLMAGGEVQDPPMKKYTEQLKEMDEKRHGLDIEITDLLAEVDTQASFTEPEQIKKLNLEGEELTEEQSEKQSIMGKIVEKIVDRQKQLDAQRRAVEQAYAEHGNEVKQQLDALEGLADLEKEMFEMFGDPSKQQAHHKPEELSDWFEKMKELRTERQRIKAEIEVIKDGKDRSAGELALMFMGINQVAQDLLMENPMTGYMQEIIFSRVLGHDEIEQGTFWVDTVQCWVCQKWDKITFKIDDAQDKTFFQQQVSKLETLHTKINVAVQEQLRIEQHKLDIENQLESIDAGSFIDHSINNEMTARFSIPRLGSQQQNGRFDQEGGDSSFKSRRMSHQLPATQRDTEITVQDLQGAAGLTQTQEAAGEDTQKNILDNRSEPSRQNDVISEKDEEEEDQNAVIDEANIGLDTHRSRFENENVAGQATANPAGEYVDYSNVISPVKTTKQMVTQSVFPDDFSAVNKFHYKAPRAEDIYAEELYKLEALNRHASGLDKNNPKNKKSVTPIYRASDPQYGYQRAGSIQRHDSSRKFIGSKDGSSMGDGLHSSVISHNESKRRKHGEPVIIQRQVFFDGVVYMIEEELYSDSDHSSVYTSEDDFDFDRSNQMRLRKIKPEDYQDHSDTSKSNQDLKFSIRRLGTQTEAGGGRVSTLSVPPDLNSQMHVTGENFGNELTKVDERAVNIEALDSSDEKTESQNSVMEDEKKKNADEDASVFKKSQKSDINRASRAANIQQEVFTNSEGLSQRQKDYEPKGLTRNYRENRAKRRVTFFEKNIPKLKKSKKQDQVYVCASFNDWIPASMKTMRTIMLERYPMDYPIEEIPKQIYSVDHVTKISSQMVPPGYHYFYFAREKGQIFLSPKHEVVRFKQTNIFLNRVKVLKRLEDIETVHQAKDGEEDEAVFMKDRSVFRDYREDTSTWLRKCFDEDYQFGKIIRTINKKGNMEEEEFAIKEILFSEYAKIINVFGFYSGRSSYPTISMNDFTSFSSECKILDNNYIGLAALDLLLVATCVSINQFINSSSLDLTRYEFLEMIVRIAIERYKHPGLVQTTVEGIERVLYELVYPHAKTNDGDNFRRYYVYSVKVNEILKKNEPLLRRIYDSYTHAKKRYIMMPECQSYVRKMGLNVSEMMVGSIYAESMMTIIDTIRDPTRPNQMKFVEFLVFLCRISHEHYKTGIYKGESLYLKLDHLMPSFLTLLNLSPIFLFGEKFEADEKLERKRAKQRQAKLVKQQKRFKETGEPVDQLLVKQIQAYQEQKGMQQLSSDSDDYPDNKGLASKKQDSDSKMKLLAVPGVALGNSQNMDMVSDLVAQTPVLVPVVESNPNAVKDEVNEQQVQAEEQPQP